MVVNKQDRVHHETEVCEYRKVKCHDCGQIQEDVETLKGSLMELDGKMVAADQKTENNHVEMKENVGKLEGSLVEMDKKINEKVEVIRKELKDGNDEVKKEVENVKKEVKAVKENLSKVNKNVNEIRVTISQMLGKLNMLELLKKLPSPTAGMSKTPREDILIAGGAWPTTRSSEIFSWEKNGWVEISPMNKSHTGASSFIYEYKLLVVGGQQGRTIEFLDLTELPLKWRTSHEDFPFLEGDDNQTVLYQQRIIHIGGHREWYKMISELQFTTPFTVKELCQMPETEALCGAEIFEDKLLIFEGASLMGYPTNVFEFDATKNECKEMPPIPRSLIQMATVRWRDQVVVLGGLGIGDEYVEALNDVFMYDCRTGKITVLPSLLEKRYECCAVITGNTIVVMGGENEKRKHLKSVECFTMGGSTWEYLPDMNEVRSKAIAEVLPSTRKYV
jgi:hypothetical protein